MLTTREPAVLVLEDGRTFTGRAYGHRGSTVGEAVFSTGMTGYQETLTDPSYHRQVVVMTAPHVGNTGWNDEDDESGRIWVAGYVVRDPALRPSSWRSRRSLEDELDAQGVVGICDLDTRALTRHLRERGAMRVGIFSGDAASTPGDQLLTRVADAPPMAGAALAEQVATDTAYVVDAVGERRFTVAAVDLGIKAMTPQMMATRGIEVHVLPATATIEDVRAVAPDGVFFSNGPGDPATAERQAELLRAVLTERIPYFGICFGNQILGRALGFGTYKLKYGHRGINQPVMDRTTGKVEVTAHNHGFAVDAPLDRESDTPFGRVRVSHVCLNDDVVEGLECLDVPAFSVQYHPEAAAGPHDAAYLFDRFVDLMSGPPERHDDRAGGACLMPKRDDIKSVLVIGSGPIVIGQACEFDYSGTQACRVLREEGIRVVLVNSNPATIMTDPEFADATYVEPITPEIVEKIIAKERPDAVLATLGGQTALNCAMDLHHRGILEKYDCPLIGANVEAIELGEDREKFKGVVAAVRRRVGPLDHLPHDGRGARRGRRARLPGRRAARRSRWAASAAGSRTTRTSSCASPAPACSTARSPRCSSRSRSWAGRSTSSR